MSENVNLDGVREELMNALKALTNKDKPMELDRAKAVAGVAKVLVDSAKVEVDYLRVTQGSSSGFISGNKTALPKPGVTVHRLK